MVYAVKVGTYTAYVDDEDKALADEHVWHPVVDPKRNTVYALANVKRGRRWTSVSLHRHLMGEPEGFQVDHKDTDGLNNRRNNLRVCTQSQNFGNLKPRRGCKSPYKGVSKNNNKKPWVSYIRKDGVRYHLGSFATEREAAEAYDEAAKTLFGAFARLNFGD